MLMDTSKRNEYFACSGPDENVEVKTLCWPKVSQQDRWSVGTTLTCGDCSFSESSLRSAQPRDSSYVLPYEAAAFGNSLRDSSSFVRCNFVIFSGTRPIISGCDGSLLWVLATRLLGLALYIGLSDSVARSGGSSGSWTFVAQLGCSDCSVGGPDSTLPLVVQVL